MRFLSTLAFVILLFSFDSPVFLEFNGTKFKQTIHESAEGIYSVKEFIPEGEREDYYFQKLSVLLNSSDTDIDASVKLQIKEFADRKKKDPSFKYTLSEFPDQNIFIFDYISKKPKDSIVDYNMMKYSLGVLNNKTSVCMTSYKMRSYADDVVSFQKYIKESREQYIEQLKLLTIPN